MGGLYDVLQYHDDNAGFENEAMNKHIKADTLRRKKEKKKVWKERERLRVLNEQNEKKEEQKQMEKAYSPPLSPTVGGVIDEAVAARL